MIRSTPLLAAMVLVAACGKKQEAPKVEAPVAVMPAPAPVPQPSASIELGRAIGTDNRVLAMLDTFGVRDTIYAAVTPANLTTGESLVATWTHESGATVKVDTAAAGGQVAFHISKKTAWPTGAYKVAVGTTSGTPLGEKSFSVAKK
jgi:hypothetical protein